MSTAISVSDTRATALSAATQEGQQGHRDLDELLTVDDVAALLKVSRSWVYEHTRNRGTPRGERLPHIKIGKYVRFEAGALRAFLDKKCRTR
jgi:excisionase family DNA binding protein